MVTYSAKSKQNVLEYSLLDKFYWAVLCYRVMVKYSSSIACLQTLGRQNTTN